MKLTLLVILVSSCLVLRVNSMRNTLTAGGSEGVATGISTLSAAPRSGGGGGGGANAYGVPGYGSSVQNGANIPYGPYGRHGVGNGAPVYSLIGMGNPYGRYGNGVGYGTPAYNGNGVNYPYGTLGGGPHFGPPINSGYGTGIPNHPYGYPVYGSLYQ